MFGRVLNILCIPLQVGAAAPRPTIDVLATKVTSIEKLLYGLGSGFFVGGAAFYQEVKTDMREVKSELTAMKEILIRIEAELGVVKGACRECRECAEG
jgi:hypothetical protein